MGAGPAELDPITQGMIAQMAAAGLKPVQDCSVGEARAMAGGLREAFGAGPDVHSIEEVTLTARDGGVAHHRLLTPKETIDGVLLFIHGGGWVMGGLEDFETLARLIAVESGCAVLQVDYRLAPEHPFPAAVLDVDAALAWADRFRREHGEGLPLFVMGDSAGGNLAAVAALHARDLGIELAGQVLIYPVVDHDLTAGSYGDPDVQVLLTTAGMQWFWDHYLGDPARRIDPDASPIRAGSLAGVAPAVVITAGFDPLRDEGEAYAARLLQSGVPVICRRFADQAHGFFTMPNLLPSAAAARAFALSALSLLATGSAGEGAEARG